MKYNCSVRFTPRGVSPHKAKSMKVIEFECSTLQRSEIISEVYDVAGRRRSLDPYALRNHWEVFEVDAEFNNPPWTSFDELCGELMGFDEAVGWKKSDHQLHIGVLAGEEKKVIRKIENYYKPLDPHIGERDFVTITTSPTVED